MPAHKPPIWSKTELAILRDVYPREGLDGCADLLADRSWHAIHQKAFKLGLRCEKINPAPQGRLTGVDLERAIQMREIGKMSFARIGVEFGICESSACNAVMTALCTRHGFTPAQRDEHGRLTDEGKERLRYALKKGLKGIDIQLRLGLSASRIALERRRYNTELLERNKAALPPPGGGVAYSGLKLSREQMRAVEALFMTGLGTAKVANRTRVSHTSCTRIRNRLVKRLRRKGECLPGCDIQGNRHVQAESSRFITDEMKTMLRALLLDRTPVRRAAQMLAMGGSNAYKIRDELAAELKAQGKELPKPKLPGYTGAGFSRDPDWPPANAKEIYAFRNLLRDLPFAEAKAKWIADRHAERAEVTEQKHADALKPKSFEEQLAAVATGRATIVPAFARAHLEPRMVAHQEGPRV
jgi:hypothetical protein